MGSHIENRRNKGGSLLTTTSEAGASGVAVYVPAFRMLTGDGVSTATLYSEHARLGIEANRWGSLWDPGQKTLELSLSLVIGPRWLTGFATLDPKVLAFRTRFAYFG